MQRDPGDETDCGPEVGAERIQDKYGRDIHPVAGTPILINRHPADNDFYFLMAERGQEERHFRHRLLDAEDLLKEFYRAGWEAREAQTIKAAMEPGD